MIEKPSDVADAADRRGALEALRDRLAVEIDGGGHQPGCSCECGPGAADGRVLATLAKEFRAVLAEVDGLPGGKEASPVDDLTARRAKRLADAAGS